MTTTWKACTQKIFWGVIVIAVAGLFNAVYDYVSIATNFMGMVAEFMPGGMGRGMDAFLAAINSVGIAVKGAIVVGYVLYLLGLKQFAGIQSDALAAQNILKVRSAVMILIWCFVASVVFGILFVIPGMGIVITLGIWIATLVAYLKMKNGFGVLMTSQAFSARAQAGARKLRTAALCNIWVMLMPIIALVLVGIIMLTAFTGMASGGQGIEKTMTTAGILLGLMVVCAIVMLIIALIFPFIGWYKIMMGGPGGEQLAAAGPVAVEQAPVEPVIVEPAPIEQAPIEQAPVQQPYDNVQQVNNIVQQSYDSAPQPVETVGQSFEKTQESLGQTWQAVTPKLDSAKDWVAANKQKVGIGVGVVALAALLIWLVPKFFDGGPLEFEKYEIEGDTVCVSGASNEIVVFIDIPKGSGSRQENVEKAIRELISQSKLALEIGAPIDGSLQEVADDYVRRFLERSATDEDFSGPIRCDLGVEGGYQNEASITLHFVDGIYGNGGPHETDYVVRLSDGHVMQQKEMVQISEERLSSILEKYLVEGNADLSEGYCLSPVGADSCKIIWPIGSHLYGEVIMPLSELEPFMTEEGKTIFKAKPSVVAVKDAVAVEEETAENDEPEYEVVPVSEMIVFENGKLGPVQVGKTIPQLPDAVEGLYDHYEHKKIEHEGSEMDDPWTEEYYLFTKGGREIFRANIYENRVYSVRLLKGSSFIRTPDGITVGFSARGLNSIKRLNWTNYYDGNVFGTEGHYNYYIDPDDLVQADTPAKNEDLKPSAKVIGIEYYVDLDETPSEPVVEQKPTTTTVQPTASVKAQQSGKSSRTASKGQTATVPEPVVAPAPPKPGEKTVNLNQLINYDKSKK